MIIVEAFIHHLNLQPHYCAKTNIKREIRKNKRLPKSTNRLIIFLLLIFSNNAIKINSINAYSCVAYSNWIFICFLKFIRATRNKKRLPIQYLTIHNKNYFYSIVLSITALWKHWAYAVSDLPWAGVLAHKKKSNGCINFLGNQSSSHFNIHTSASFALFSGRNLSFVLR
jgi:hypothetical protein